MEAANDLHGLIDMLLLPGILYVIYIGQTLLDLKHVRSRKQTTGMDEWIWIWRWRWIWIWMDMNGYGWMHACMGMRAYTVHTCVRAYVRLSVCRSVGLSVCRSLGLPACLPVCR